MNSLDALAQMHVRILPRRRDHTTAGDWADVLATYPLFKGISKRRLRKIARTATIAEFAPGETIISAGDHGDALYVILAGEADAVSKHAPRTFRTGDYFGELALIDGRRRSATVLATSDVHLIKLPCRTVLKLARRNPALTLTMLRHLTARLRQLEAERARAA